MSTEYYPATSYIGGGAGALDAIPVATLGTGDIAVVSNSTIFSVHHYDASSAAAESSPDVINPDDNGGNGRWLIVKALILADGTIFLTADWDIGDGRAILTDKVRARDGAGLLLEDDEGNGVEITDGGIIHMAKQSATSITEIGGQQTIADDSFVLMTFDEDVFDVQGESDLANNRITVQKAGVYLIILTTNIDNMLDGKFIEGSIYVNGSNVRRTGFYVGFGGFNMVTVSHIANLSAGDHVQAYTRVVMSQSGLITNDLKSKQLSIVKIA